MQVSVLLVPHDYSHLLITQANNTILTTPPSKSGIQQKGILANSKMTRFFWHRGGFTTDGGFFGSYDGIRLVEKNSTVFKYSGLLSFAY